jgi:hypothetical protein
MLDKYPVVSEATIDELLETDKKIRLEERPD